MYRFRLYVNRSMQYIKIFANSIKNTFIRIFDMIRNMFNRNKTHSTKPYDGLAVSDAKGKTKSLWEEFFVAGENSSITTNANLVQEVKKIDASRAVIKKRACFIEICVNTNIGAIHATTNHEIQSVKENYIVSQEQYKAMVTKVKTPVGFITVATTQAFEMMPDSQNKMYALNPHILINVKPRGNIILYSKKMENKAVIATFKTNNKQTDVMMSSKVSIAITVNTRPNRRVVRETYGILFLVDDDDELVYQGGLCSVDDRPFIVINSIKLMRINKRLILAVALLKTEYKMELTTFLGESVDYN